MPEGVGGGVKGASSGMQNLGWISPVSNAISSVASGVFGLLGRKSAWKHDRQTYERQLADNRENWRLENLYNSPQMQMERLKAAGLNPNLVYGNGAVATGGEVSPTQHNVTEVPNPLKGAVPPPGSVLGQMYDLRQQSAQTSLTDEYIRSQISLQKMQAATAALTALETTGQSIKNQFAAETARATIDNLLKDLDVKTTNIRSTDVATTKNRYEIQNLIQKKTIDWQQHNANLQKITQEILHSKKSMEQMNSQIGLNKAHTTLAGSQNTEVIAKTFAEQFELFLNTQGLSKNSNGASKWLDMALNWLSSGNPDITPQSIKDYFKSLQGPSPYPNLKSPTIKY